MESQDGVSEVFVVSKDNEKSFIRESQTQQSTCLNPYTSRGLLVLGIDELRGKSYGVQ